MLSQQRDEADSSPNSETRVRAGSSCDNDGADQHCQMIRVRQARSKGIREKPVMEPPQANSTDSNLADMGRATVHAHQVGDSEAGFGSRWGGHDESLRRSRGEAVGE